MTSHTLEALQRMTGPELNKAVAEVLGWTDVRMISGELWGWTPNKSISARLPDWSGDIGAAWKLVRNIAGLFQLAAQIASRQGAEVNGNSGKVSSGRGRVETHNANAFRMLPVGAGRPTLGDEGLEPPTDGDKRRGKHRLSKNVAQNPSYSATDSQSGGLCPFCGHPLPAAGGGR